MGRVAPAEADIIEGWLAYGAALNEGRGQFHPEDDKGFGQWVSENLLSQVASVSGAKIVTFDDRAAAMWAAANSPEFDTARQASNARPCARGTLGRVASAEADAKRNKMTDAYAPIREAAKERQKEAGENYGKGHTKLVELIPQAIDSRADLVRAAAKERQKVSPGRPRKGVELIPQVIDSRAEAPPKEKPAPKTRDIRAKAAGTTAPPQCGPPLTRLSLTQHGRRVTPAQCAASMPSGDLFQKPAKVASAINCVNAINDLQEKYAHLSAIHALPRECWQPAVEGSGEGTAERGGRIWVARRARK